MERKTWFILLISVLCSLGFVSLSLGIKDTSLIWFQTRAFGLISFAALFITLLLGELRMLSFVKADFPLFRYHKPIAIASVVLVLMHFVSALADSFKWGAKLRWWQYLGFSFSDKWLTLLSLGTIAFYLMLMIGITSQPRVIQKMGYKNWRVVHYISYASFLIAYIHAVNLGTDIKHSSIAWVVQPLVIGSFFLVLALLAARIATSFGVFEDQWEVSLSAFFFVLLIIGSVFTLTALSNEQRALDEAQAKAAVVEEQVGMLQEAVQNATVRNEIMRISLGGDANG